MKFAILCCFFLQLTNENSPSESKIGFSSQATKESKYNEYVIKSDTIVPQEVKEEVIYIGVEQPPKFPGGNNALQRFLKEKVTYTEEAKKKKIRGRVLVQFVIEKDGSIGKSNIMRGLGYGLDEIVLDVVKSMPNWEPPFHNNKAVRMYYTLAIPFEL